ncbi:MAG: diphthine synthase [Candidatus Aenigmatarchaeota archaeon]
MFILAGIGQNKEEIPVGVVSEIKNADFVFLEYYTNIIDKETLDYLFNINKNITLVNRKFVEEELEKIIISNPKKKIILLVSGSPLFATTHAYFLKLCKEKNIDFKVINAASIFDEIGKTGLFLYKFGKTVSIPFHEAESFFDDIIKNYKNGYHTLILLDLDPETGKYLSLRDAIEKIVSISKKRKLEIFQEDFKIIVCSNLGRKNEKILYITISEALNLDLEPPICIIIPSNLNNIEKEILECMKNY